VNVLTAQEICEQVRSCQLLKPACTHTSYHLVTRCIFTCVKVIPRILCPYYMRDTVWPSCKRNIYTMWQKLHIMFVRISPSFWWLILFSQEAKLMLTNQRDAFRGQTGSQNMVPFEMLGTVTSCIIVNLSLRCTVFFRYSTSKMLYLEIRVRGDARSMKVVPLDRLHYDFLNFSAKGTYTWYSATL